MKRVFRRPSPAMVVAIVGADRGARRHRDRRRAREEEEVEEHLEQPDQKLAPGLSVASAKTADNAKSTSSSPGPTTFWRPRSPAMGLSLFAAQGGTGVHADTGGSGVYGVLVPRDIDNCAIVPGGQAGSREINAFQSAATNRVGVLTFNSAGASADAAFSLVIVC